MYNQLVTCNVGLQINGKIWVGYSIHFFHICFWRTTHMYVNCSVLYLTEEGFKLHQLLNVLSFADTKLLIFLQLKEKRHEVTILEH